MRFLHLPLLLVCIASALPAAFAVPVEGHRILISAPNVHAVETGRKIAARGGNVVDVAVAVGLTLSVTAPYYAALGGGGFAMIKMNQVTEALDFRETAPLAAGREDFLKLDPMASRTGGRAVAVPGVPAGLWALHQRYGRLKWRDLFGDALSLATNGYPVSGEWVRKTQEERERFTSAGLAKFFRPGGVGYKPGEIIKQPDLGKALGLMRSKGANGFYQGPVAADVVSAVKAAGGRIATEDLKSYKVRWLSPLTTEYEGRKIYLMPPPSSAGVLIHSALKLIEKLNVKGLPALSADEAHMLGEIQSRVFRGRALLGDPDFHQNPVQFLTSLSYIDGLRKTIDAKRATTLAALKPEDARESSETTHYSVLDNEGHAIAVTVTLNDVYGSGVVTPKYGIAMNNEMDDFTTRPGEANLYGLIQGPGNEVQPGKRPLSSMSPALVERNGKVEMAIGSPGGPRIITGVLQVLYRILGRGEDADQAVQAPRVHHQFLPNLLYVDKGRFAPEVLDVLKSRGHKVEESNMGKVYVVRLRDDGVLEAAFDARGEGAAGGI